MGPLAILEKRANFSEEVAWLATAKEAAALHPGVGSSPAKGTKEGRSKTRAIDASLLARNGDLPVLLEKK